MSIFDIFKKADIPNLTAAEFIHERKQQANAVLLDVRTHREFNEGHIPGATLMNVQEVAFSHKLDDMDKDAHYFLYCRSGRRSMMACRMMQAKGFTNTYNLAGGILTWPERLVRP